MQTVLTESNPEYEAFVQKFQPKLTTDDCYTPPAVYDTVRNYCIEKYGVNPESVIRPFYPGGDYEHEDYTGKFVIDNPPFSIISKIVKFYHENNIPFFLFAPSLTAFSGYITRGITRIITDSNVVYDNGAVIRTSFITNLEGEDIVRTDTQLMDALNMVQQTNKKQRPKYSYPSDVIRATDIAYLCNRGIDFHIPHGKAVKVSRLDAQRELGKEIFGSGLLVSVDVADRFAAAKAAADENVFVFELSEREREIQGKLS